MQEYQSLQDKKDFFSGKYKRVNNIDELKEVIERLEQMKQNEEDDKAHFSFRGVNEAHYKMYNSLQRLWHTRRLDELDLDPVKAVVTMLRPFEDENCVLRKYLKQMDVVCND